MIRLIHLAACTLSAHCVLPTTAQTINEDIKIVSSDAAELDEFGYSVAIWGKTAVIGAHWDDDAGTRSGSAYLFNVETGLLLFKLTADDAAEEDWFGDSVAISGTTAIIGAYRDDDGGDLSGSAYVFDTVTGDQLIKLNADDAAMGDFFGKSVGISGAIAIVGNAGSDSAYLFDTITGNQLFKFTDDDSATVSSQFAYSVAISGNTAIIGAFGDNHAGINSGSAYLFDTVTGEQLFKLTASDAAVLDHFGFSVAISGTTAIVGAYKSDDFVGSAYLFDTVTGQQLFKLTVPDAEQDDLFGYSVAISGTTAIVGTPNSGDRSGSAYLFDTETGLQIGKLIASDAEIGDALGWSVGISGTSAIAGAMRDDDAGDRSGSAYKFTVPPQCAVDITADGQLDFFDISLFLTHFQNSNPIADFNTDGQFDFPDISAFLTAFTTGCP